MREDLKVKEVEKEAEQRRRGKLNDRTLLILPSCCPAIGDAHLVESGPDLTRSGPPPFPQTDKLEDAKAKERVREQIEADKRARAEKAAREKALREGQPVPESQSQTQPPTASSSAGAGPSSSAPAAKKEYTETRLQVCDLF